LYFWLCTHRATHQITKSSDGVPQLKKLLNLKEWLTAPEAAHHLSLLFGEDVRESDVRCVLHLMGGSRFRSIL
jgi:hypothetical protein